MFEAHTYLEKRTIFENVQIIIYDYANFSNWKLLVRAECVRCPWLLAQTKVATILGIFPLLFLLLPPLFKTTEGVVVLFQIFAWAPKKNNKNLGKKNF